MRRGARRGAKAVGDGGVHPSDGVKEKASFSERGWCRCRQRSFVAPEDGGKKCRRQKGPYCVLRKVGSTSALVRNSQRCEGDDFEHRLKQLRSGKDEHITLDRTAKRENQDIHRRTHKKRQYFPTVTNIDRLREDSRRSLGCIATRTTEIGFQGNWQMRPTVNYLLFMALMPISLLRV